MRSRHTGQPNFAKWTFLTITAITALFIIFAGVVPMIMQSVDFSRALTESGAYQLLEQEGYAVAAPGEGWPANFFPTTNSTYDLGTAGYYWNDAYLDGTIYSAIGREATFTVAAADAPANVRAQADYTDLQTAITAAGNYSSIVAFGSFIVNSKIVIGNNHFTLDLRQAKLTPKTNLNDFIVEISGASDILVYGGEIDGNKANQSSDSYGIRIANTPRVVISNVYIHDTKAVGISVGTGTTNCRILNNTVTNCGSNGQNTADGIDIESASASITVFDVIVSGNYVSGVGDEGIGVDEGAQDVIIVNNIVKQPYNTGISADTHATHAAMLNIIIANNQIVSPGVAGISVVGNAETLAVSRHIDIHDNQIYGSGSESGISVKGWLSEVTIENNLLTTMTVNGIYVTSHTSGATTKYPIVNRINNNYIYRTGEPTGKALSVLGTVYQVIGNYIESWRNNQHGIHIVGVSGTPITYSIISDNYVNISAGTSSPIKLEYVTYSQIHGNIVKGRALGGNYGIFESAGCDYNWIYSNDVSGISDAAKLTKTGSSTIVIRNKGYTTENSGTATITNGNTTILVNHGLNVTPSAGDIIVCPIEALGSATQFWVGNLTATNFTIYLDGNPGQDVDFAWSAQIYSLIFLIMPASIVTRILLALGIKTRWSGVEEQH